MRGRPSMRVRFARGQEPPPNPPPLNPPKLPPLTGSPPNNPVVPTPGFGMAAATCGPAIAVAAVVPLVPLCGAPVPNSGSVFVPMLVLENVCPLPGSMVGFVTGAAWPNGAVALDGAAAGCAAGVASVEPAAGAELSAGCAEPPGWPVAG